MPLVELMSYSAGEAVSQNFRCGLIAIAGRPNVGKSTLLNRLLDQKISITSKKANTTRHRILGVLSEPDCQYIFIDTPGYSTRSKRLVDRSIHKVAISGIIGVDLVLFVVESRGWQPQDVPVWNRIESEKLKHIVVVSKMDRVGDKALLLPVIDRISEITGSTDIVPVSAKKNINVQRLKTVIAEHLPESPPLFSSDFITDRDNVFYASEIIREQVFRYYGEELPYSCAVQVEKYEVQNEVLDLHALIWMETESQKRMIIGSGGSKLKLIGTRVRQILESRLNTKVYVRLWVKVRTQWTEDQQLVSNFGFSVQD